MKLSKVGNFDFKKRFIDFLKSRRNSRSDVISFSLANEKERHKYEMYSNGNLLEGITLYCSNSDVKDSFEILSHEESPSTKLLVLSEGEGVVHTKDGDVKAPDYVTKKVAKWFSHIDGDVLDSFDHVRVDRGVKRLEKEINKELYKNNARSKLIFAIVNEDSTYIRNIGNLRAYLTNGMNIFQMNEEDSDLWRSYRKCYISNKDEMRFSNDINNGVSMLGKTRDIESCGSSYLFRTDYDKIFLFSRGVVDTVEEDRFIVFNSDYPNDKVAKRIVDEATNGEREPNYLSEYGLGMYHDVVHDGKDATVCSYVLKYSRK